VPNGRPKRSSRFNMKSIQRSLPTVKARQTPGSATPHFANPRDIHSNRHGKGHNREESIATSGFAALVCVSVSVSMFVSAKTPTPESRASAALPP
jgi:hypothetical protein